MVFASLSFLCLFLPLNLLLYYTLKKSLYRNLLLTTFSLLFYAMGEPVWVLLLVFSAAVDYGNAFLIERYRHTAFAKLGLWLSLLVNLGLLVAFKYSAFIYENINLLLGTAWVAPTFTLPIGISFYTFQTISYTVDVYRGEVAPQRSFLRFLMYVSLYPQLIAGPIVRYAHVAQEIDHRRLRIGDIHAGIHRFCIGLFKKVFIANIAAEWVLRYLEADFANLAVGEAWFGLLMFSVQIYFDFSGYSDMAIGLGRMFGFRYQENFRYPYIARSATEFWRRWHISLGSFFRDYVYIPLGGNRKHGVRNLLIVWFLTGLWHGASWNFVLWGLYFGLLIFLERAFLMRLLQKLPAAFSHFDLLGVAVLGWALFYFTDFTRLFAFLKILFGFGENPVWSFELGIALRENVFWLLLTGLLCMPVYLLVARWYNRRLVKGGQKVYFWTLALLFQYLLLLVSLLLLVGNSYNPFIYYRF